RHRAKSELFGLEQLAPARDLALDVFRRRRAGGAAALQRFANVEDFAHVLAERVRSRAKLIMRKSAQSLAACCELSDNSVRLAEGDAFAYEILGQIGRQQLRIIRQGFHSFPIDGERWQHCAENFERAPNSIDRIEERLLVFLQVAVVSARQAFQDREQ